MDVDPELRSAKDATTLLGDTEGFAAGGMLFNVPQVKNEFNWIKYQILKIKL